MGILRMILVKVRVDTTSATCILLGGKINGTLVSGVADVGGEMIMFSTSMGMTMGGFKFVINYMILVIVGGYMEVVVYDGYLSIEEKILYMRSFISNGIIRGDLAYTPNKEVSL